MEGRSKGDSGRKRHVGVVGAGVIIWMNIVKVWIIGIVGVKIVMLVIVRIILV